MVSDREFDRITREVRPRLVNLANKVTRDRDDAEDVVQSALLEAWAYSRTHPINSLEGLLFTMTHRKSLRLLSDAKRRGQIITLVPLEDWSEDLSPSTTYTSMGKNDPRDSSEHLFDTIYLQEIVADISGRCRLTGKQRRRIALRYVYEKTYEQIGEMEGVLPQTISLGIQASLLTMRREAMKEDYRCAIA